MSKNKNKNDLTIGIYVAHADPRRASLSESIGTYMGSDEHGNAAVAWLGHAGVAWHNPNNLRALGRLEAHERIQETLEWL